MPRKNIDRGGGNFAAASVALLAQVVCLATAGVSGTQQWSEQPRYQEVNPGGQVVMPCIVLNKKGECRWERDDQPVGIHPRKYEWAGGPKASASDPGDCSLRILNASLDYDDGVWQCQVTSSSFDTGDVLLSKGAKLVVRGED